jgi:hypothetical protein
MAHGRREDPRDNRYSGRTYLHSADASQHHLSENEHAEGPPQSTVSIHDGPVVILTTHTIRSKALLSSQYLGYAPWNAPPHSGIQEPCYAVPCANDSALGYGAWNEMRPNLPPVPVMASVLFIAMFSSLTPMAFPERRGPIHRSGGRKRR